MGMGGPKYLRVHLSPTELQWWGRPRLICRQRLTRISWMTKTSRGHSAPTISWRPRMGRPRVTEEVSPGTRHVWWARVRVRTVWPRAPRGSHVWSASTVSRVSRVQTVISAARAVKGDTDTGLTSDLAVNSSLPRMFIFNQNSNDFYDFLYTLNSSKKCCQYNLLWWVYQTFHNPKRWHIRRKKLFIKISFMARNKDLWIINKFQNDEASEELNWSMNLDTDLANVRNWLLLIFRVNSKKLVTPRDKYLATGLSFVFAGNLTISMTCGWRQRRQQTKYGIDNLLTTHLANLWLWHRMRIRGQIKALI